MINVVRHYWKFTNNLTHFIVHIVPKKLYIDSDGNIDKNINRNIAI